MTCITGIMTAVVYYNQRSIFTVADGIFVFACFVDNEVCSVTVVARLVIARRSRLPIRGIPVVGVGLTLHRSRSPR